LVFVVTDYYKNRPANILILYFTFTSALLREIVWKEVGEVHDRFPSEKAQVEPIDYLPLPSTPSTFLHGPTCCVWREEREGCNKRGRREARVKEREREERECVCVCVCV